MAARSGSKESFELLQVSEMPSSANDEAEESAQGASLDSLVRVEQTRSEELDRLSMERQEMQRCFQELQRDCTEWIKQLEELLPGQRQQQSPKEANPSGSGLFMPSKSSGRSSDPIPGACLPSVAAPATAVSGLATHTNTEPVILSILMPGQAAPDLPLSLPPISQTHLRQFCGSNELQPQGQQNGTCGEEVTISQSQPSNQSSISTASAGMFGVVKQVSKVQWVRSWLATTVTNEWKVQEQSDQRPSLRRSGTGLRLSASNKEKHSAIREAKKRFGYRFVHSCAFEVMSSIVLLLNMAYLGLWAESALHSQRMGEPTPRKYWIIHIVFTCVFLIELLARFAAGAWLWAFGPDRNWNVMESILIVFSLTSELPLQKNLALNFQTLRLLRTVRLLMHLTKIKAFQKLRIVVLGIVGSVRSLSSVVLVIAWIIYAFAVFFVWGVARSSSTFDNTSGDLSRMFGGLSAAMFTLFMSISGGIDWSEAVDALSEMSATPLVFQAVFVIYTFIMYFAVLNVVIGAVVTATADIIKHDKEALVSAEQNNTERFFEKISALFRDADENSTGILSWDTFQAHLESEEVKNYFHALELDVSQARALYKMLDVEKRGEVDLNEFVSSCMHLKNQAKSLDIKLLMYQNELSSTGVRDSLEKIQDRLVGLEKRGSREPREHKVVPKSKNCLTVDSIVPVPHPHRLTR